MQNKKKDTIQEKQKMPTRKKKDALILGQMSKQHQKLDQKAVADESEFDKQAQE